MKTNQLKLYAGIVLVFFLGVLVGSLGTRIYFKQRIEHFKKGGPLAKKNLLMEKLSNELDLTQSQQIEIGRIVEKSLGDLQEFRQKNHADLEKIIDHGVKAIKSKLNEDQEKIFERMYEKLKNRRRGKRFFRH